MEKMIQGEFGEDVPMSEYLECLKQGIIETANAVLEIGKETKYSCIFSGHPVLTADAVAKDLEGYANELRTLFSDEKGNKS